MVSPEAQAALVRVSADMLRFPYHTRYELIEFAVFTLAARVRGLVSLHAACVGRGSRGLLLMGASGSGKSTLALQCLLQGFEFVSEDSTLVAPDTMLATGVANFLHVRADSLRWVAQARDVAAIRSAPVITRRSGVKKFEVDLRLGGHRLATSPLELVSVVFLSAKSAARGQILHPLTRRELVRSLTATQVYASKQPHWATFCQKAARLSAFELRRGRHPLEAVEALRELLRAQAR
jgi:energy-coupling factor transporter ATP-binding protein EcfA2